MADRVRVVDILPLTPFQEGVLFHALYDREGPDVYHVQYSLDLAGDLDPAAMRAAADALVRRNAALRAAFRQRDNGQSVQLIVEGVAASWRFEDLRQLPAERRDVEVARLTAAELDRRFDLAQPASIRFTLIRSADDQWRLLLTNHHILLDGWSMPVLLQELFRLYERRGDAGALPAPVPHRDHLAWLVRQDTEKAREAWRAALAGLTEPTLVAPADPARLPVMPHKHTIVLPAELAAAMTRLAKGHGLTANTIIQGAWAILLARLTGRDDVCFGATVSGRSDEVAGAEEMIGSFINVVPVRVRPRASRPVVELLAELQEQQAELLPHQHLGLTDIQRTAGLSQLYDTVVIVENYPLDLAKFKNLGAGLSLAGADVHDAAHVPLRLVAIPFPDWQLQIDYRPDLFAAAEAKTIGDRLIRLLEQICGHPERALGRLSILGPDERARLITELTGAHRPEAMSSLLERVHEVAAAHGEAPAVIADGVRITYAELVGRAGALSRQLLSLGIPPGGRCAIYAERGVNVIVGVLGTHGAGHAFLPLDTRAPAARNASLLQSSGADVLLAGPEHAETAAEISAAAGVRVVVLGEAAQPAGIEPPPVRPDQAAYLLYTSGSTGLPKGALVHHLGMVNHLAAKNEDLDLVAADVVVQNAPLTFDVSVWQMLAALTVGGCVLVVDDDTALDPVALFRQTDRERVTVLEVVPSLLRAALDAWDDGAPLPGLETLRWLLVTGEALSADLCRRWFRHFPGVPMVNAYGPTECSDDVTHGFIRSAADVAGVVAPIGRAVRNTELYVLDQTLQPAPAGTAGELYVGGQGVGLGYLDNPLGTALAFVPDPFSGRAGARLYRTGDLVRRLPDGQLEFLGRTDHQVKIRGRRVELGEIEAALRTTPGTRDAVVMLRADTAGHERLVAYLAGPVDPHDAHKTAESLLPPHMVPAVFVVLDSLPVSPNGKIDRKALPVPQSPAGSSGRAPRTATEKTLADLFADVLGTAGVTIDDNFFQLGGHSLLATRLVSRIRATLNTELPTRAIFEAPTIAALAARLTEATGGRRPALTAGSRPAGAPLSYAQRRLWFLAELEGPSATYNLPNALRFDGPIDHDALHAALGDLIGRHESLRTLIRVVEGEPTQHVLEDFSVPLQRHDSTAPRLPDDLAAAARRPFHLDRELPLRADLFTLDDRQHVLLLTLHHIAGDGWSFAPLAEDLTTAYQARRQGQAPGWAPLPVQYIDYTLWQQKLLGTVRDEQLAYWRQKLEGLPDHLVLPTDRPRPAIASHHGATTHFTMPATLHRDLTRLARRHDATLFMVIHAGLAALLTRLGAGTDIPIGAPIAGRTDPALDKLIGFFVNTLVLRTTTADNPTFTELLQQTRATNLDAYTHQDLPFDYLVEALNPNRSLARHPFFQVMLVLQNVAKVDYAGLGITDEEIFNPISRFDLVIEVNERFGDDGSERGLQGFIQYADELFDRATIEFFVAAWERLLTAAAADPTLPVGRLPVLGEQDRHDLMAAGNARQSFVLDDALEPVPYGVLGELYVSVDGPAADTVANPFGPPGTRLRRTGNLAKWTRQGELHVAGRVEDQVLIDGVPVHPAEIAARLADGDLLSQAVVVADEDGLLAYVVPRQSGTAVHAIRRAWSERLPDYLVPRRLVLLDALPLTAAGTVDTDALPAPPEPGAAGPASAGGRETILRKLFAEVLEVPSVTDDDNFFDLGGHSLLAVRLLSRIRSELGVELNLRDVMMDPTVAGVAEALAGAAQTTRPPLRRMR
ncbi:amino acid adenylation domain-containing protein [Micromonospora sp. NPDC007230]|uniref:amino acid adenylation domain-containing protein n=1 Tax=Micromonospora sp. NPDC007230 TaxID=3364237 RepID=UPI003695568A